MENYIVSARKYRPQTFESVVGQQSLTDTLRNAIRQNHLAHAYLFCGPRGVGKTTCARIFAKTINCLNPTADHDACNQCESCQAFNEQRSFNIHELDAASNNSVEDIRALIQEVRIPPQIGKYSVYIIDEVHMLSQGAFNALLKTLEEPPSYAIFILATTEKHKVLPTILSRCQVYDFHRITIMDMVHHLQYVAKQEGVEADEEALTVVAQKADGGLRDALSIFDQLVAFCGNHITYEQTIHVLNVLDSDYYFRLTRHALQGEVAQSLLLFNDVLQHGFDAQNFVVGFAEHLRDVLVSRDAATTELLETSDTVRQQYVELAKQCPPAWLFKALDLANTCDVQYRTSKNRRLTVELFLVKLCQLITPEQSAPQPVQVQPVAQPAPAQAAKPVQPAKPVKPVQPVQPVQNMAMPKIPSLKTGGATQQQSESRSEATQQVENRPFTSDQFLSAWAGLKQHFPQEERLIAMLSTYRPELLSPTLAQLTLSNPLQRTEFVHFAPEVMHRLREILHNTELKMQVVVQEYDRKAEAYTAAEKYKVLAEQNPYLQDLKTKLALQLD